MKSAEIMDYLNNNDSFFAEEMGEVIYSWLYQSFCRENESNMNHHVIYHIFKLYNIII
jgi:hypothetical protein